MHFLNKNQTPSIMYNRPRIDVRKESGNHINIGLTLSLPLLAPLTSHSGPRLKAEAAPLVGGGGNVAIPWATWHMGYEPGTRVLWQFAHTRFV